MNKKVVVGVAIVTVALILVIFYKEFISDKDSGEDELDIGARCVARDWPYCGCTPPDGGSCETEDYNARCEDESGKPLVFCEVYYNDKNESIGCYCRDNKD